MALLGWSILNPLLLLAIELGTWFLTFSNYKNVSVFWVNCLHSLLQPVSR